MEGLLVKKLTPGWKKDVIEWEKLKLKISEFIKGFVNN